MICKKTHRKWHKWLGLGFCIFVLAFAMSGIILNHRHYYGKVNVSRRLLPESYRFSNWNNGLLRGSLRIGTDSILIYGAGGIFLTNEKAERFSEFSKGMPASTESRSIRNIVKTSSGELFACSQFDAYRYMHGSWHRLPIGENSSKVHATRFSDVTAKGDTVLFVGRDQLYVGLPPYNDFRPVQLQAPEGYTGKVSLFRSLWLIHNGEIFGLPGRVFIDLMGMLLIFFCLTGIAIWILPTPIKKYWQRSQIQKLLKWNYKWHNRIGKYTYIPLMFITLTGFALRPPLLITLVSLTTPPIPYSSLDSSNPWQDKLRALRWDAQQGDWLLSTSEGFFTLKDFEHKPMLQSEAPPVSVMGINVLQRAPHTQPQEWLVGSFSGLYRWNRTSGQSFDYATCQPVSNESSSPFGKTPVSGYSSDFDVPFMCTYTQGTEAISQPMWMTHLPMSAWQLALEVHTGRIFTALGPLTLLYVFISGILIALILWTGWKIRAYKS